MTGLQFTVRLLLVAWIARDEVRRARWLPWWRRYLSLLPASLWLINAFEVFGPTDGAFDWTLTVITLAIDFWNTITSRRNKRDGNDRKKAEAAEVARLTEVQQTAFRREAHEAA